jgi:hypothetical protein
MPSRFFVILIIPSFTLKACPLSLLLNYGPFVYLPYLVYIEWLAWGTIAGTQDTLHSCDARRASHFLL